MILILFISYSVLKFISNIEGNTKTEIQIDSQKISTAYKGNGINGKALFQEKCASCHHPILDGTGPALLGAIERAPNKKLLYEWIRNSQKVLESGDRYYKSIYIKYNKTPMNLFPNLTDEEIEAILLYASPYKQATAVNNF